MKILFSAAIVAALALAHPAPATAGPFEEVFAAYDREDYEAAFKILEPLALGGDARAQAEIAELYYYGQGVPKNRRLAHLMRQKAAAQGLPEGILQLGHEYFSGVTLILDEGYEELVPVDRERGLELIQRAAELGYAKANIDLGEYYYETHDHAEAANWFLSAAEASEHGSEDFYKAADYLGIVYQLLDNYAGAAKWYLAMIEAAEPGSGMFHRAAIGLGNTYYRNLESPDNFMLAYMWYAIAVDYGGRYSNIVRDDGYNETMGRRDNTAERYLTAEQVAEAQAMAEDWMKQHHKLPE